MPCPPDVFRGAMAGDASVEQYMQIEMFDYHDHPNVTMTWR